MLGSVLDRAQQELNLAAKLRDACRDPRRRSFESRERLVQPTSQVLHEVVAAEGVRFGDRGRVGARGPVEVDGRDLAVDQLGIAGEEPRDEVDRALEPCLGERVEAELAAAEIERADSDPLRETIEGALDVECARGRQGPAGE